MTPTPKIELCTAGPFYGIIESHAKAIGLPISPYRFVRQQDIKLNGEEVFPRIWSEGKPNQRVINGGEPGLHDHERLAEGAGSLWSVVTPDNKRILLDLEPENWQEWFKKNDYRRLIDAFDVIRATVNASASVGTSFTFYPEMWNKLQTIPGFVEWWQSRELCPIDGYLYDAKNRDAWTREEYAANIDANLNTLGLGIPTRKLPVFRTVGTSGEWRINTEQEERMMTDVLRSRRLNWWLIWVGCDTQKQALASAANLTPERLRWMREGGAA